MSRLEKLRVSLWCLVPVTLSGFLAAATVAAWNVERIVRSISEERIKPVTEEGRALLREIRNELDDTYWTNKASAETTAALLRESHEFVRELRAGVTGEQGIVSESRLLIVEARERLHDFQSLTEGLTAALDGLTKDAQATLQPLRRSLENVASLTSTVDAQIAQAGPQAQQSIEKLNRAIDDVDRLLSDPSIQRSLTHIEHSAESLEIAMAPWRKKAHQAKVILSWILSRFRIALTPPW